MCAILHLANVDSFVFKSSLVSGTWVLYTPAFHADSRTNLPPRKYATVLFNVVQEDMKAFEMDHHQQVHCALAVYVKNPNRSGVKSRLAKGLSAHYAKQFYKHALACLQEDLQLIARMGITVFICPADVLDLKWAQQYWQTPFVLAQIQNDNLGDRMQHTIAHLRKCGFNQVCIIGSDAPTLPISHILSCQQQLESHDVVLGPALDGGIYLLGANLKLADLTTIPWSSHQVFDDLKALLKQQALRIGIGPSWYDVDTIADFKRLKNDLEPTTRARKKLYHWLEQLPRVSIVIPVLNEGKQIKSLISQLQQLHPIAEIIIVDGGSEDNTWDACDIEGVKRLQIKKANRAVQMNHGAQLASGNILLFLHADCHLSQAAFTAMIDLFSDDKINGGCFRYHLAGSDQNWHYRWINFGVRARVKLFKLAYGDQGYFVRKNIFNDIGAFKVLPLLEDVEWFSRLKKTKNVVILKEKLITSARRIQQRGWIRSSIINNLIVMLYFCGVQPALLARIYYNKRMRKD